MGFETCAAAPITRVYHIIKQSLWDLKQLLKVLFKLFSINNKAVPMGFETCAAAPITRVYHQ